MSYTGNDFYCDEVLSGHTHVILVRETATVLAFHHTQPHWPLHIVVIPKAHVPSLLALPPADTALLVELLTVVQQVAQQVVADYGACRIVTNLGDYQDSKHLHWHIGFAPPQR